jgi:RimJ/RimL family protein N-acetyltransferase
MVRIPWAPDYPVATERLDLRPHRMADLDDLTRYHSDPEVVRYIPWPERTLDETRRALEARTRQGVVFEQGSWLVLAMEVRETGRVIGEVLLKYAAADDRCGELGYAMAADVQGQGYASEAARAMLRLGFEEFGLHRVMARLDARNGASARLLERIGMRLEARHVESSWFKGEWTDDLIYAMLEREWRAGAG